ncbi:MAG TPA: hypothetical protein VMP89_02540, partial [Solirubrobacteraceae bacterium]|nr:hypothetical protein [Solirubrobacteraceae bacterium]
MAVAVVGAVVEGGEPTAVVPAVEPVVEPVGVEEVVAVAVAELADVVEVLAGGVGDAAAADAAWAASCPANVVGSGLWMFASAALTSAPG